MDMDAQLVPEIGDPKPDDDEEEVADMDEMMAQMEEEQKNESAPTENNIFA